MIKLLHFVGRYSTDSTTATFFILFGNYILKRQYSTYPVRPVPVGDIPHAPGI